MCKRDINLKFVLDDGNQYVSRHSAPDLRLDCVLACSQKGFDSQVLLAPFEEQFDLPSLTIECCDQFEFESKVVRQKGKPFAILVHCNNATNDLWIFFGGVANSQHTSLIANDLGVRPIDVVRVSSLKLRIGFCTRHEVRLRLMSGVKPFVVEVASIQQIECLWLDHEIVQNIDLVSFAVHNADKALNCALQVQQRVQFDRALGSTKWRPRINRQTQIDCGHVERIIRSVQIDTQKLVDIKWPRNSSDQMLSIFSIDLPRTRRISIGKRIARRVRETKSHVMQTLDLFTKIDCDIAKRLSISQLCKRHCEELIQAGEVFDLVIGAMRGDVAPESCQWWLHHDLRKNEFALVHDGSSREVANKPQSARIQS